MKFDSIDERNAAMFEGVVVNGEPLTHDGAYGVSRPRALVLLKREAYRRGLITAEEVLHTWSVNLLRERQRDAIKHQRGAVVRLVSGNTDAGGEA